MKKIILLIGVVILMGSTTAEETSIAPKDKETYVYLCMGSKSKRYHKTDKCKGLSRCSTRIKVVTLQDAIKKYKRTPCKKCY